MRLRDRFLVGLTRAAFRSKLVVRALGRKRRGGVDAALDPQLAAMLEFQRIARFPALASLEPVPARKFADTLGLVDLDPVPMASVDDIIVPGPRGDIPVRIFVPPDAGAHWIFYLHGGGGVIGSVASSEPATRLVAAQTRCTIASVDYRLGPEHKHPAAIDDAVAAWAAIVARVPAGARIAVAGDSFGGYLSAHVDHAARARGLRQPDVQVMIYPIVDETLTSPALDRLADGYLLTKAEIVWFSRHYHALGDDKRASSPLFWPSLAGAAPAIVVVAGYDPLCEEGEAYAERLRTAGVDVRLRRHASLVHGFMSYAGAIRAGRTAVDELCVDIVDALARSGTGPARAG